jgi:hypothetical protein
MKKSLSSPGRAPKGGPLGGNAFPSKSFISNVE